MATILRLGRVGGTFAAAGRLSPGLAHDKFIHPLHSANFDTWAQTNGMPASRQQGSTTSDGAGSPKLLNCGAPDHQSMQSERDFLTRRTFVHH